MRERERLPTPEQAQVHMTVVTRRILARVTHLGLDPRYFGTYRGAVRVTLDAGGIEGLFGSLDIGKKTGKVLRLTLHHGNSDGRGRKYLGVPAVHNALKAYELRQAVRDQLTPWPPAD